MALTRECVEKEILAALNENGVLWAPGQVTVNDDHIESRPDVFDGEIFKGALAGYGLRVMNIGSVAAMLRFPKDHPPSGHRLTGIVSVGGLGMPLNTETAEVVWRSACLSQNKAS